MVPNRRNRKNLPQTLYCTTVAANLGDLYTSRLVVDHCFNSGSGNCSAKRAKSNLLHRECQFRRSKRGRKRYCVQKLNDSGEDRVGQFQCLSGKGAKDWPTRPTFEVGTKWDMRVQ